MTAAATALAAVALAPPAAADMLHFDPHRNPDVGYTPIQELSYEAIVGETDGYRTTLRIRVALHNSSARKQDAVLNLATPHGALIRGLRVARNGTWSDGKASVLAADATGRREPGTVYARPLKPETLGDLPGVELVAFSLDPSTTTQIELRLEVPVTINGDRWELVLPGRGDRRFGLANDRRVLVKDPIALSHGKPLFWINGERNAGHPFMITTAEEEVVVAWPALKGSGRNKVDMGQGRGLLKSHYTALPNQNGAGGKLRLHVRLGPTSTLRPDHVVVLIDQSRSVDASMHRAAANMSAAIFDALPGSTTFDAIAFDRKPTPLVDPMAGKNGKPRKRGKWPSVRAKQARTELANALDARRRGQGTDMSAALAFAGERIRARNPRKPLIIVLTDGMLPTGTPPGAVRAAYHQGLGKPALASSTELLFLVDEPMVSRAGLGPEHPITALATALGARIRLETFAKNRPDTGALLSTPRVVHDLEITMPSQARATLDHEVPGSLVAGHVIELEGTYAGKSPPTPSIRARAGKHRVSAAPRAKILGRAAAVLAAAVPGVDGDKAAKDGYVRPPWLTRRDQRLAQLTITWAGRGGAQPRGYLDRRIFQNYLGTRVYPRARACYNVALTRNQVLGGRVELEMEVGKGEVMLARVARTELSHPDKKFEDCLTEAAWALDIPAGKLDDRIYRVRYPLNFLAPRGGQARVEDDPLGLGTLELLLGSGKRGAQGAKSTP